MMAGFTVAFLGPVGTFTHESTLRWLAGRGIMDADLRPCATQAEAINLAASGEARYAVVAVATSFAGPIQDSAGAVASAPVSVVGELTRVCHYHLLAMPGATLAGIREVRSNRKAFDDCAKRLRALLPGVGQVITASTAAAAQSVAADGRVDVAAVGTDAAAALYRLTPLASEIEDDSENWTTWVIVEAAPAR